jgi:hypothetical protein
VNFQPALAAKVLAGEKTVTRRLVSVNPRSPWWLGGTSLVVGRDYAVCPGRGKVAIARVVIRSTRQEVLGILSDDEAQREGFACTEAFELAWSTINGGAYDATARVWRVAFELVPTPRRSSQSTVKLTGGPFDGAEVPRPNGRWTPINAEGTDVPEGFVACYRPTRDKDVWRFAGYERVLVRIPMPGVPA